MKKLLLFLTLPLLIFIIGCPNDDDLRPDPPSTLTCAELCNQEYIQSRCGSTAVLPNVKPCTNDETNVGQTSDCNSEEVIGALYNCCCKGVKRPKSDFKKTTIIQVTVDEPMPGSSHSGKTIIANIFITPKGVTTTFVRDTKPFTSDLLDAIEAAKSEELTLESESLQITDQGESLIMTADVIEQNNEQYILPLRGYLAFDYEWSPDIFDFDLIRVTEWIALKDTSTETLIDYTEVFEFGNIKDGFIISAGDGLNEPEVHPFLNIRFKEQEVESEISNIIDESVSFIDFIQNLVENNYIITDKDGVSILS